MRRFTAGAISAVVQGSMQMSAPVSRDKDILAIFPIVFVATE
jgi:hypothetical protein